MIFLRKARLRPRRVVAAGVFALLCCGAAGLGMGLWVADDRAEIQRLRDHLASLEFSHAGNTVPGIPSSQVVAGAFEYETVLYQESSSQDKAYLGVSGDRDADPKVAGVPIYRVYDGTPASAAGLEAGDLILGIADTETDSVEDLRTEILRLGIGAEVSIHVRRGDETWRRAIRLASWKVYNSD